MVIKVRIVYIDMGVLNSPLNQETTATRDLEVLKAVPILVNTILPKGYCRGYSSLHSSLTEGRGDCLAFMKWGGAVLSVLKFCEPWYQAISCYPPDYTRHGEIEHGCLVIPSVPAYFDSQDGLVSGIDCSVQSNGTLRELTRHSSEPSQFSDFYLSYSRYHHWIYQRYSNFYSCTGIKYPKFATDKVLEIVAADSELVHLLPAV